MCKKCPNPAQAYNNHFMSYTDMHTTSLVVMTAFQTISKTFNRKWHPSKSRDEYVTTFSIKSWNALHENERTTHKISKCNACTTMYPILTSAFPAQIGRLRKKGTYIEKENCENEPATCFEEMDCENQMETEHAVATTSSSANVQELQYRDVGTLMTS